MLMYLGPTFLSIRPALGLSHSKFSKISAVRCMMRARRIFCLLFLRSIQTTLPVKLTALQRIWNFACAKSERLPHDIYSGACPIAGNRRSHVHDLVCHVDGLDEVLGPGHEGGLVVVPAEDSDAGEARIAIAPWRHGAVKTGRCCLGGSSTSFSCASGFRLWLRLLHRGAPCWALDDLLVPGIPDPLVAFQVASRLPESRLGVTIESLHVLLATLHPVLEALETFLHVTPEGFKESFKASCSQSALCASAASAAASSPVLRFKRRSSPRCCVRDLAAKCMPIMLPRVPSAGAFCTCACASSPFGSAGPPGPTCVAPGSTSMACCACSSPAACSAASSG